MEQQRRSDWQEFVLNYVLPRVASSWLLSKRYVDRDQRSRTSWSTNVLIKDVLDIHCCSIGAKFWYNLKKVFNFIIFYIIAVYAPGD